MLGTRQLQVADALEGGRLVFEEMARRIGGSRRELLLSVARLELAGTVQVARLHARTRPGDLVKLAQPGRMTGRSFPTL